MNLPFFKDSETHRLPIITLLSLLAVVVVLLLLGIENFMPSPKDALEKANVEQVEVELPETNTMMSDEVVVDSSTASTPDSVQSAQDLEAQKKEAEASPLPEENLPSGKDYTYTVGKGETFFGIANRFGLSKDQLLALNPGLNPEGIKVGVTKIKLKVKAVHIVGKGDILRVVAAQYGISKQKLMEVNRKKEDLTMQGEELLIPLN